MNYLRKVRRYAALAVFVFLSFNLYFLVLMPEKHFYYLGYLDFLLLLVFVLFFGTDYFSYRKREKEKLFLMRQSDIVCTQLPDFENKDVAVHDVAVLNEKLNEKFNENCELQDYAAKCCHELKLPLSSLLLLHEKIEDIALRRQMREQLEKMKQQANTMLLGCKVESALFDLQVKRTSLSECVRISIHNNQFFLIRKGFCIEAVVGELWVFTDPSWLVYILDQLLNNAVKYAGDQPKLRIWTQEKKEWESVLLYIEDNGEGIRESDIRRIFEKGYTGSNYHNGRYKSTGMGLYMAEKIIRRLGHEISVESEYGKYTRFCIAFYKNAYFFREEP